MQAILSVFRGETTLAEIPDQVFDTNRTKRRTRRTGGRRRRRSRLRPETPHHRRPPPCRRWSPTRTSSASSPTRPSPACTDSCLQQGSDPCCNNVVGEGSGVEDLQPGLPPCRTDPMTAPGESRIRPVRRVPAPRRHRIRGPRSPTRRASVQRPTTSPGAVARQSDSSTVILRPAWEPESRPAAAIERPRHVGGTEATGARAPNR